MVIVMNDRYLSLQTAQEKFDVSRQTLLNWEEQGLIHPGKTPGGQRRYSETEILDLFGLNDTSTQPNKCLRDVARRAADLLMNQYGEMIDEIILYGSVARGGSR